MISYRWLFEAELNPGPDKNLIRSIYIYISCRTNCFPLSLVEKYSFDVKNVWRNCSIRSVLSGRTNNFERYKAILVRQYQIKAIYIYIYSTHWECREQLFDVLGVLETIGSPNYIYIYISALIKTCFVRHQVALSLEQLHIYVYGSSLCFKLCKSAFVFLAFTFFHFSESVRHRVVLDVYIYIYSYILFTILVRWGPANSAGGFDGQL